MRAEEKTAENGAVNDEKYSENLIKVHINRL